MEAASRDPSRTRRPGRSAEAASAISLTAAVLLLLGSLVALGQAGPDGGLGDAGDDADVGDGGVDGPVMFGPVESPPDGGFVDLPDGGDFVPALPVGPGRNGWAITTLKVWGFNDAMRKNNRESYFGRYFYARRDQVLTAARLTLNFNDEPPITLPADIRALEISLNDQVVATIDRKSLLSGPRRQVIRFDPHLLSEINLYVLRFLTYSTGPCQAVVEPGAWWIIKDGMLETQAAQLPLPNNLGMLPVPFFDQRTDREPTVQIAFLEPPTPGALRAASLVASYFGVIVGSGGVRFPTTIGHLPRGHAVVLTTVDAPKGSIKLGPTTGATVSMVDHPSDKNYKLLVLHGRDSNDLEIAAQNLAMATWGTGGYEGASMRFDAAPESGRVPRELPRWFITGRETTFANLVSGEGALTHRGHAGGTLQLEFRITPETLAKPAQYLLMDVEYLQRIPAPYTPPRLDVEFNGIHVRTLPAHEGGLDATTYVEHLVLPRNQLRGANRVQFHIGAVQHRPLCNADSHRLIETTVSGKSMLRLVGETDVVHLPDVEAFVYDGLPFTRKTDLGRTTVILPTVPLPQEIGTALSVISNFAGATGRPTSGIDFMPESGIDENTVIDRDLLAIGAVGNSTLLTRWSERLPLESTSGKLRVRMPRGRSEACDYLRARMSNTEYSRAASFLNQAPRPGVVMGGESPLASGRSLVFVAANTAAELPAIIDLQGYTEARLAEGGDLLILDEEKRAVFHLGPSYTEVELGRLASFRYLLGEYWLSLFILTFIAVVLLSLVLRNRLVRRERARLGSGKET